jgi:hypothetical protein
VDLNDFGMPSKLTEFAKLKQLRGLVIRLPFCPEICIGLIAVLPHLSQFLCNTNDEYKLALVAQFPDRLIPASPAMLRKLHP